MYLIPELSCSVFFETWTAPWTPCVVDDAKLKDEITKLKNISSQNEDTTMPVGLHYLKMCTPAVLKCMDRIANKCLLIH